MWASKFLIALAVMLSVPPQDSGQRWRQDIAVARQEFLLKDRSYSRRNRAIADHRLGILSEQAARLTDQQIVAELARVAALAGNAHTRAYLLRNRGWWRRYPIRVWKFSDGWRVVATRPGNEELLGARITSIAGKSVGRAEAAVAPLYAGPPTWQDYMATYTLTSPDALLGTGILMGTEDAALGLEKDGRRFSVTVRPSPEPRRQTPEESWWFLSPAHPATAGWAQVLAGRDLPAYLDHPANWYDARLCRGGIVYFSFSRSEDQPGRPTLAVFGQALLDKIAGVPVARLVIDLRFNTGGNLQKTQDLFRTIARSEIGQTRGRLFVVMGPSTFSAGITPAAILKQDGKPVLVGSNPGDRTTFWAEGGNVTLPNSGINLHYADRAHVYVGRAAIPDDMIYLHLNAGSLAPDRPASQTFAEYARGDDIAARKIDPNGLRCEPATSS